MAITDTTAAKGRGMSIALWVLKGLVALAFLAAGLAKLAGVPMLVEEFDKIGLGQGFRYVTGVVEIIGAIAILAPGYTLYGVAILAAVLVGAFIAQLGPLHGDVVHVLVLATLVALVGWLARPKLP